MDGKKRKKAYQYVEGHRRETRKSYQSFIEKESTSAECRNPIDQLRPIDKHTARSSGTKTSSFYSQEEADEMTDRVRKSSRTPVPKKSFDLVDSFEINKAKDAQAPGSVKVLGQEAKIQPNLPTENVVSIKKEPADSDSDASSRKSHRTPIPKKTFDLIDSSYSATAGRQHGLVTNPAVLPLKKNIKKETIEPEVAQKETKSAKAEKKKNKKGVRKDDRDLTKNDKNLPTSTGKGKPKNTSVKEKEIKSTAGDKKTHSSKRDRKRKHDEVTESHAESKADNEEGPLEKAAKYQQENLDESVLMEALQALNQEPKDNSPVAQSEEKAEPIVKEKRGRRSTSKMIAAKSLHKTVRVKTEEIPVEYEVKVKQEKPDYEENEFSFEEPYREDINCSTTVTERSDGHIILKLGGLNSPTKVKKHKKKHKHHHHHRDKGKNETQETSKFMPDHGVVFSEHLSSKAAEVATSESYVQTLDQMNPAFSSESQLQKPVEQKHKKSKNPKRKRSVSIEPKIPTVENIPHANEELVVKKRKIYKKKKGEKILVRIQTEYWSKSGELVKVEPAEVKEKSDGVKKVSKLDTIKTTKVANANNKKKKLTVKPHPSSLHPKNITKTGTSKHKIGDIGKNLKAAASAKQIVKERDLSQWMGTLPAPTKKPKFKPKTPQDGTQSSGSSPVKKKKERKTQTLTAYLLYCRKYRHKIVSDNPEMGFSEISKQLAKMWGEASEKEKDIYKKQLEEHRAKVNATKRKQNTKLKTTKQAGSVSPDKDSLGFPNSSKKSSKEYQIAPQKYNVSNLEPIDMAAHLQLLGESLTLVATALRRQGNMKVHGALSVLLDSCICAMAPLMFLTSSIPQIDVIPAETKANILDNVAYILPGL